jgi:hypothetical protein
MKNFTFIIGLLIVTLFSACEEDEDIAQDNTKTLSGNIYKNCNLEPYSNLELDFYTIRENGFSNNISKLAVSTVTDSNGYYSIEYTPDGKFLEAQTKNGELVFSFLPNLPRNRYDYYGSSMTTHTLKILSDTSFRNTDTLLIGAYGSSSAIKEIKGPFNNLQTLNVSIRTNITPVGLASLRNDIMPETNFYWGLGAEEFEKVGSKPDWQIPPFVINDVNQSICGVGDTVLIDLRGDR